MDITKQAFLVAYDYGTGGLWGVMLARSATEISEIYPKLFIVGEPPTWMDMDELRRLERTPYDIDGPPWGLLKALLADRERE